MPDRLGESTRKNRVMMPSTTVAAPSRRKIQRQGSTPPTPPSLAMPAARKLEKAPDSDATAMKSDRRKASS